MVKAAHDAFLVRQRRILSGALTAILLGEGSREPGSSEPQD